MVYLASLSKMARDEEKDRFFNFLSMRWGLVFLRFPLFRRRGRFCSVESLSSNHLVMLNRHWRLLNIELSLPTWVDETVIHFPTTSSIFVSNGQPNGFSGYWAAVELLHSLSPRALMNAPHWYKRAKLPISLVCRLLWWNISVFLEADEDVHH